jgi:hypothetical protein
VSREHFSVFAGKSSVELRVVAGLAQIPLSQLVGAASEGGVWRHARQRNFGERTVSLGIRGAFWGKPFDGSDCSGANHST